MKREYFITVFICFLIQSVAGQYKFEREYRIEQEEVPKQAIEFIENVNFKKKVKWYVEESQDGKTIEAKTTYKGRKHSIEFDTKGAVIDVEIKINFSKLDKALQKNIISVLKERFKKFKIRKVQLQFKGQKEALINCITSQCLIKPSFEIVLKGKKETTYELFEMLFDSKGEKILKELKFSADNFDNLQF